MTARVEEPRTPYVNRGGVASPVRSRATRPPEQDVADMWPESASKATDHSACRRSPDDHEPEVERDADANALPNSPARACPRRQCRGSVRRWLSLDSLHASLCAAPRPAASSRSGAVDVLVGLPQRRLLHLAHRVARQRFDEDHALRRLEFRESAAERGEDRRLGQTRRPGAGRRPPSRPRRNRVRNADHGAFDDALDRVDLVSRPPSDRR